jgi:uncharacterized repeat protein (TIGR01451 family)
MKKINKVLAVMLGVALILGLVGPNSAQAATAPVLGVATGYSVFGNAGVTNNSTVGTTHVWGNVGGNGIPSGTGVTNLDDATQVDGAIDAGANALVVGAISFAYGDLADEALTQIPVLDLDVPNTVTPGVYDIGVGVTFTDTLTLNGAGVYIFRSAGGTVARTAGGTMSLTNGACASNVFWQIADSMTFATGVGSIYGTIITNTAAITFADAGVTLQGRAWAATQVTMINTVITEPTCATPTPTPTPTPISSVSRTGTVNVVKNVINDSGGTKVVSNFPLFVNDTPVTSGVTVTFPAPGPVFTVTETGNSGYTTTFSGDCDTNGQFNLSGGDNKFCIVTNNDIGAPLPVVPPLIDVVKVPNPLALPSGPGPVTYTYTLTNTGTVPVTNVTMVGDTCSPIVRVSGDANGDNKLDVSETWIHTCSTTLSETHTNIVTTTGWANGISAVDIATATVIVGAPITPPLIHVTKVPNPLALLSGGGVVTYTNKVTNPGTVALSNVRLTDDKCAVVSYVSGDANSDSKLDSTETWTYTCSMNLTQTTTNTVIAAGDANGLTARDIAVATVVVAVPSLPSTGVAPDQNNTPWNIIVLAGISAILALFYFARRKQIV